MHCIKHFLITIFFIAVCACNDHQQMLSQLEELERQNLAGSLMTNDTLAISLCDYFDSHGTPNERMRAKYILGRTYYCLGELPHALELYYEAADCADTLDINCDYAKLSRIHAQSANIFHKEVQPRSELKELKLAEYYAWKGKDTLMAIECYAQRADAYDYLHKHDSIIFIQEHAAQLFTSINRHDRAAQTISTTILSLINIGDLDKARKYCNLYENNSGFFDNDGNIDEGLEIYYYIKGQYYLAVNKTDSAEYLFRKELRIGKDLNNQIAGCKGLQEVFITQNNSDSIAKYANLSYILNDSAYSLSEMQNIQKLQLSYNYNHHKILAEKSERRAEKIQHLSLFSVMTLLLISILLFMRYRSKKARQLAEYRTNLIALEKVQSELQDLCGGDADISTIISKRNTEIAELQTKISEFQKRLSKTIDPALEDKILEAKVIQRFHEYLESNPVQEATTSDIRELKNLINELIPNFYGSLNSSTPLRAIEYEVCLLIRCHFKPASISKLLGRDDAYISNIRRRLLKKIYDTTGNPKELDDRILRII